MQVHSRVKNGWSTKASILVSSPPLSLLCSSCCLFSFSALNSFQHIYFSLSTLRRKKKKMAASRCRACEVWSGCGEGELYRICLAVLYISVIISKSNGKTKTNNILFCLIAFRLRCPVCGTQPPSTFVPTHDVNFWKWLTNTKHSLHFQSQRKLFKGPLNWSKYCIQLISCID